MRDQMNQGKQLTKPLSQKKRYFQGGETKQMRKITAYLLIFALVFTLVVPAAGVASAQTAGQKLKELGLIQGNLSGDLMENAQWKRQDLVVALARMLGEESVAQATPKTHTFTDVTDPFYNGYISWSVNKGYIQGHSATKFGYGENVTNHQFVAIMLRALGHDTRGANYEAAKQLAVQNGLVPANTDWNAASNRGALYTVMLNTVDAKVVGTDKKLGEQLKLPGYVAPAITVTSATVVDNKTIAVTFSDNATQNFTLATALEANKETAVKVTYKDKEYEVKVTWKVEAIKIDSVKAVGASKIEVKFNAAVDTSKAVISVTRGNIAANVKEVKFADDKKSAVVELVTKIVEGNYTVSVAGVANAAITATFAGENEKVGNIEFVSENLLLDRTVTTRVTAVVRVTNQYGENVTNSTLVSATNAMVVTPSKGTVLNATTTPISSTGVIQLDVTSPATFVLDEKVVVHVLNPSSGTFKSSTLTVSATPKVATINITELLHNVDDKKPLRTNSTSSEYVLVLTAKDQYGNNWGTDATARARFIEDVVITVSNSAIANVNTATLTTVGTGANTRLALSLTGPLTEGSSVVSIVSRTTGNMGSFTIKVERAVTVDQLTVTIPDLVVTDEKVKLPFVAVDQFGNAVTDVTLLNTVAGMTNPLSVSGVTGASILFERDHVAGATNLFLDLTGVTFAGETATAVITGLTGTNKVISMTVTVREKAKPVVITGVTSSTITNFVNHGAANFGAGNLTILDQYGRTISGAKLGLGTALSDYSISISTNATGGNRVKVNGANSAAITATGTAGNVTFTGQSETGTATYTAALRKDGAEINGSAITFTLRNVAKADIATYVVEDVATLFVGTTTSALSDPANYSRDLVVFGQLASGAKVAIPTTANVNSFYTVNPVTTGLHYNTVTGKVYGQFASTTMFSGSSQTTTATLVVTIDAAGGTQIVTKPITLSRAAAEATEVTIRSNNAGTGFITGALKRESASLVSIPTTYAATFNVSAFVNAVVQIKDQYGVTITTGDFVVASHVTNLPANRATVADVLSGESFDVTTITNNGKIFTFKVVVR